MATNNDSNKKLPAPPSEVTEDIDIRYTRITVSPSGTADITYQPVDLNEASEKAFREQIDSSGGYITDEAHKKQQLNTSMLFEERNYNVGGVSKTAEGHVQEHSDSTRETSTKGDKGETTGGRKFLAILRELISTIGGGTVEHVPPGSENPQIKTASGDSVNDFDGNRYINVAKDKVETIQKNNVLLVKDGDYDVHVQEGNYDIKVNSKAKIFSADDLLIQSATKITLRVGTSTIVITPDNIEIIAKNNSGRIDLNPGTATIGTGNPSET